MNSQCWYPHNWLLDPNKLMRIRTFISCCRFALEHHPSCNRQVPIKPSVPQTTSVWGYTNLQKAWLCHLLIACHTSHNPPIPDPKPYASLDQTGSRIQYKTKELSFDSMGLFVESRSPYDFSLVGLHTISRFLSTCGACSKVVFEFEWRATYFRS